MPLVRVALGEKASFVLALWRGPARLTDDCARQRRPLRIIILSALVIGTGSFEEASPGRRDTSARPDCHVELLQRVNKNECVVKEASPDVLAAIAAGVVARQSHHQPQDGPAHPFGVVLQHRGSVGLPAAFSLACIYSERSTSLGASADRGPDIRPSVVPLLPNIQWFHSPPSWPGFF